MRKNVVNENNSQVLETTNPKVLYHIEDCLNYEQSEQFALNLLNQLLDADENKQVAE